MKLLPIDDAPRPPLKEGFDHFLARKAQMRDLPFWSDAEKILLTDGKGEWCVAAWGATNVHDLVGGWVTGWGMDDWNTAPTPEFTPKYWMPLSVLPIETPSETAS